MADIYKRRHIRNLDELDKEQEKIRRTYRRIESDWLSGMLNPQQMVMSVATSLLSNTGKSKKKNKGKENKTEQVLHSFSTEGTSSSPAINIARNIISNPTVKGFLKNTAASWLRWQAFNLAVYLGKKAYKSIKHKKEEKRLKEELANLTKRST